MLMLVIMVAVAMVLLAPMSVKFCQTFAYDYYDYFASAYIINMLMPLRYLFPVISKLVYAYTM